MRRLNLNVQVAALSAAIAGMSHLAAPVLAGSALLPPIEPSVLMIQLDLVANGFSGPAFEGGPEQFAAVELVHANDGSDRLFVATIGGVVRIIGDGRVLPEPFLNTVTPDTVVNPAQYGLTGLAFHPGYADPRSPGFGKLYSLTTEHSAAGTPDFVAPTPGNDHHSVIHEWRVDPGNPNCVDLASSRELMRVQQPRFNHNVNQLVFGPEGYLYVSIGDGGNTTANSTHAQQLGNIFGSILRIDVDLLPGNQLSANGQYAIPHDNPFVDDADAAHEIYAYGLRNPWRMSFDRVTGQFYCGDVGQRSIEEFNQILPGGNYGWNHKEGGFLYDNVEFTTFSILLSVTPDLPDERGLTLADQLGLTDPIAEYDHLEGRCAVGGAVYRGSQACALAGRFVFADATFGRLFALDPFTRELKELQIDDRGVSLPSGTVIYSLAEDETGELYVLASVPGPIGAAVLRIASASDTRGPGPSDLNDDGVVNGIDLGILLASWSIPSGQAGCGGSASCPADVNCDGAVDGIDLGALLADWTL